MEIGDCTRFVPKGWECPKCGRVYAPDWPFCTACGGNKTVTTDHVTIGDKQETMDSMISKTLGSR